MGVYISLRLGNGKPAGEKKIRQKKKEETDSRSAVLKKTRLEEPKRERRENEERERKGTGRTLKVRVWRMFNLRAETTSEFRW